ncbi:MAG TPA: RNA methyltransferase [Gammaproteobacteria bacterium]
MQIPVRIVLVETTHPGNVGASARAMKTMGLEDLALVAPRTFPSDEATARASGAADLLERASVHETLEDAIADCAFVVGTSARSRGVEWPCADPREAAARIWDVIDAGDRAAVVFGREQSGLTNEALARCMLHVQIPTDAAFSSLNLAMAVQVLCYELRMTGLLRAGRPDAASPLAETASSRPRLATSEELEHFHAHLERILIDSGFIHESHPRQLKLKLRRIFQRAGLDKNEIDILRGVLTSLDPARRAPRRRSGQ